MKNCNDAIKVKLNLVKDSISRIEDNIGDDSITNHAYVKEQLEMCRMWLIAASINVDISRDEVPVMKWCTSDE